MTLVKDLQPGMKVRMEDDVILTVRANSRGFVHGEVDGVNATFRFIDWTNGEWTQEHPFVEVEVA